MAYNIKQWFDHIVQYPNRFKQTSNGDGTITETPVPGEILQQGTPQNAANFNNNEQGTFAANDMGDFLTLQVLQLQRGQVNAIGESGIITLTNTAVYPFNDSASKSTNTVALDTPRDTTDYTVTAEVQSVTGGAAGDINVSNKLRNGFALSFDGSASEVVVRYAVTGGGI
jgi:hypothetical protein